MRTATTTSYDVRTSILSERQSVRSSTEGEYGKPVCVVLHSKLVALAERDHVYLLENTGAPSRLPSSRTTNVIPDRGDRCRRVDFQRDPTVITTQRPRRDAKKAGTHPLPRWTPRSFGVSFGLERIILR